MSLSGWCVCIIIPSCIVEKAEELKDGSEVF